MITRLRQLQRALARRCPLCGNPWPRQGRIGLAPQCPVCQLRIERGEGDFFLGAYTFNLLATLAVAVLVTFANVTWHQIPAVLRYGLSFLLIAAFALWFYAGSKLIWLIFDLQFRPPIEKDFNEEAEE